MRYRVVEYIVDDVSLSLSHSFAAIHLHVADLHPFVAAALVCYPAMPDLGGAEVKKTSTRAQNRAAALQYLLEAHSRIFRAI